MNHESQKERLQREQRERQAAAFQQLAFRRMSIAAERGRKKRLAAKAS